MYYFICLNNVFLSFVWPINMFKCNQYCNVDIVVITKKLIDQLDNEKK